MTDREIVLNDIEAIYIGNIYTIEADLDLPLRGQLGSEIRWASGFKSIIADNGKVTRPRPGTGSRQVTLTATVRKGGVSMERIFEATVLEQGGKAVIIRLLPVRARVLKGKPYRLPSHVIAEKEGGIFGTVPVVWNDKTGFELLPEGDYDFFGAPLHDNPELIPYAKISVCVSEEEELLHMYSEQVREFSLGDVKLRGGYFDGNRKMSEEFLLSVDDDRMLYNFRAAAGLDVKNVLPMTGWDAPECLLRGHTTGHYLSAIALAFAGSSEHEGEFALKISYMVSSLKECQDVMEKSGKFAYGFLSGYGEEQFDKLEQYEVYPKIWAPYYTLHKIMAGLLDCYEYGGSADALEICKKIGIWVYNRLAKCSREQLDKMWSMYIAGEFGGMNEVLARLYKLVPKKEYIDASKFFDNDRLFIPMAENIDTLGDMHANQHVPQILGALEMYARTGENRYFVIAKNFWRFVTGAHIFNIGGAGEGEMFKAPNQIAAFLTEKTAESCVSYNMLKLTKMLFRYEPTSEYMDYYERALYSHIAASLDPSGPTGGSTYFMPLCPGGRKEYDIRENTCCHGTGLENHVKYQEAIFFEGGDRLYINLYISSELEWKEKGLKITLEDDYLKKNTVKLVFAGKGFADLRLRIPGWLCEKPELLLNGKPLDFDTEDGYAVLRRDFTDGDEIWLRLPFSLRLEKAPDNPEIAALYYGPLVMVIDEGGTEFIRLDVGDNLKNIVKTGPLEFEASGHRLIPNFMTGNKPYHAYFTIK